VYIWVIGQSVVYVGSAVNKMGGRMNRCRSPVSAKRPDKSKVELHKAVQAGKRVRFFVCHPVERRVRGLSVEICVDLERVLIKEFNTAWNTHGRGT
jgi:hypothetical protein